jgi:hypothetical protein
MVSTRKTFSGNRTVSTDNTSTLEASSQFEQNSNNAVDKS